MSVFQAGDGYHVDNGRVIVHLRDVSEAEFRARSANVGRKDDFTETVDYDEWCDTHASNGLPLIAHWTPGLRFCEFCGADTCGEDLCPSCLSVVEPFRQEPWRHYEWIERSPQP